MGTYISKSTVLYSIAVNILSQAMTVVPIDTGSLYSSGRIDEVGDGLRVSFGAGVNIETGKAIDYATWVHDGHPGYDGVRYLAEAATYYRNEAISNNYPVIVKFSSNETIDGNTGCVAVYLYEGKYNSKVNDKIAEETPGVELDGSFDRIDTQNGGLSRELKLYPAREAVVETMQYEFRQLMSNIEEKGRMMIKNFFRAPAGVSKIAGIASRMIDLI